MNIALSPPNGSFRGRLMQTRAVAGRVRTLIAVGALVLSGGAQAGKNSLPTVSGPIPVTADSQIYGAADVPGASVYPDLAAHGYLEEEYFLSGKANVYGYDEHQSLVLKQREVPYTTQLIVRKPKDPGAFSGNIQFEPMHPTYGLQPTWSAVHDYILRHGDAYVALGVGADAVTRQIPPDSAPLAAPFIVKWFDPRRYAAIQWPDEDGIRWDVIIQAGRLLRIQDRSNPLAGYNVEHIYASGWSYTGSLWRTFINEGFDRDAHNGTAAVFDGYLIGMSAGTFIGGYLPINSSTEVLPEDHPRRAMRPGGTPVIQLLSETDALTNVEPQPRDSDEITAHRRLYEVGGISHGDGLYAGDITKAPVTLQLAVHGYPAGNRTLAPTGCDLHHSDVPMAHLAAAALSNLDQWVRSNLPPPRTERVAIQRATGRSEHDDNGNAKGGVRVAQLEVPLARYVPYEGNDRPACVSTARYLTLWRQPFDRARLTSLYRNKEDYLGKFKMRLDRLVRERWILAQDAEQELAAARAVAREAFD